MSFCQRPPDTSVTEPRPAALLDPQHQLHLRVGREGLCPEMFKLAQIAPRYRGLSAESRTSLVSSREATGVRLNPAPHELPTHLLTWVTNGRGQRLPTRRLQIGRIVSALRVGPAETTCSTLQHAQLQAREHRLIPHGVSETPAVAAGWLESRQHAQRLVLREDVVTRSQAVWPPHSVNHSDSLRLRDRIETDQGFRSCHARRRPLPVASAVLG